MFVYLALLSFVALGAEKHDVVIGIDNTEDPNHKKVYVNSGNDQHEYDVTRKTHTDQTPYGPAQTGEITIEGTHNGQKEGKTVIVGSGNRDGTYEKLSIDSHDNKKNSDSHLEVSEKTRSGPNYYRTNEKLEISYTEGGKTSGVEVTEGVRVRKQRDGSYERDEKTTVETDDFKYTKRSEDVYFPTDKNEGSGVGYDQVRIKTKHQEDVSSSSVFSIAFYIAILVAVAFIGMAVFNKISAKTLVREHEVTVPFIRI